MKRFLLITTLLLCSLMVFAEDQIPLIFPDHGFSIQSLEAPTPSPGHQIMIMFLPGDGVFAPNINVMSQDYPYSIEEYSKLTDGQFAQLGLEVISSSLKDGIYRVEYRGNLQGRDLHFYARALKKGDQVYLTTGTSTPAQWKVHGKKLMETVDSFDLLEP